jgi:hypothetical protein
VKRYDFQGVLFACGADVPAVLPGGWHYFGGFIRQGDAPDAVPFLLVCYRRRR